MALWCIYVIPNKARRGPRICRRLGNGGKGRKEEEKRGKGASEERWESVEMLKNAPFGRVFASAPQGVSARGD